MDVASWKTSSFPWKIKAPLVTATSISINNYWWENACWKNSFRFFSEFFSSWNFFSSHEIWKPHLWKQDMQIVNGAEGQLLMGQRCFSCPLILKSLCDGKTCLWATTVLLEEFFLKFFYSKVFFSFLSWNIPTPQWWQGVKMVKGGWGPDADAGKLFFLPFNIKIPLWWQDVFMGNDFFVGRIFSLKIFYSKVFFCIFVLKYSNTSVMARSEDG